MIARMKKYNKIIKIDRIIETLACSRINIRITIFP